MMNENTYNIGDLVQHKASGERGIITYVHKGECQNPTHTHIIDCITARKRTKKEENPCLNFYIDLYSVSIAFKSVVSDVPGLLLKKIAM